MIDLKEVLLIHKLAIQEFGGSGGIRDIILLDSAIKRPFAIFDNRELYPKPSDKAASILESIIKNHPFIDGNKRTAYILMRLILLKNNLDLTASKDDKYTFVLSVAEGKLEFEGIKTWIENRLILAKKRK